MDDFEHQRALLEACYPDIVCGEVEGEMSVELFAEPDVDLEVLGKADAITTLVVRGHLADEQLRHFRGLTRLRQLDIGFTSVEGFGLAYVGELSTLEMLLLTDTLVAGRDLQNLVELSCLKELSLENCVNVDSVASLGRLPSLEYLSLSGTQVVDDACHVVASLSQLKYLLLDRCQISDLGAAALRGCQQLRGLSLADTGVADCLRDLCQLTRLEYLSLDGSCMTPRSRSSLGQMKTLKELSLDRARVDDAALRSVHELVELTSLSLNANPLTDTGAAGLSQLAKLELLELAYTNVTDACVAALSTLKNLVSVLLEETHVTDAGADELKRALPDTLVSWSTCLAPMPSKAFRESK